MSRNILFVAVALTAAACSSAKAPEIGPDPTRGLRSFTGAETEVAEIVAEAALSLPPEVNPKPAFSGVYLNGRRSRNATDAVVRATGFTAVSTPAINQRPECRSVSSTGVSTPIPCPASAAPIIESMKPPVYSFLAVRATADSAYVGSRKQTSRSTEDNCITLIRAAGKWSVLRTVSATDAARCGE